MVLLDIQVTTHDVASLQISHFSGYKIIQNILGDYKVCARWVLKQLTILYKQMFLDMSQHLHHYDDEDGTFLNAVIHTLARLL